MNSYKDIPRPPRRRAKADDLPYDQDLEDALRGTLASGRAIQVPLAVFHSSPAKMRLWKDGLLLRHRVLPGREFVAAWVDKEEEAPAGTAYTGNLF